MEKYFRGLILRFFGVMGSSLVPGWPRWGGPSLKVPSLRAKAPLHLERQYIVHVGDGRLERGHAIVLAWETSFSSPSLPASWLADWPAVWLVQPTPIYTPVPIMPIHI